MGLVKFCCSTGGHLPQLKPTIWLSSLSTKGRNSLTGFPSSATRIMMIFMKLTLLATTVALATIAGVHAQSATGTTLTVPSAASPQGPSSSFDSSSFNSATVTDTSVIEDVTSTGIVGVTESSFAPTITSCFITPTGSYPMSTEALDPEASNLPEGAECFMIIRQSGGNVEEKLLYTVDSDGTTISFDSLGVGHTLAPSSSTSAASTASSSSKHTGTIVGAVIGSVFGTLFVGATLIWIRRQRRSNRPSATWFNRPAGWVQDEKPGPQIEMSRRVGA